MNFLEQSLDQKNQAWKYILVIIVGFVGGQILGSLPILHYAGQSGAHGMDFESMGISSVYGLVLMILPFVVSLLLCWFMIKSLHKREFTQIVNGTQKIRWSRIVYAAGLWSVFMVFYLIFEYAIDPANFVLQLDWESFLTLLVAVVVFIPIQTTCEEFLMRGYFAQGLAGVSKNRWVALVVPGVIFALLHSFNPEVEAYGFWLVMPQYLTFGLAFGLMSILDDGIELAIGAHAANNVFLSLFLTNQDSVLQTDAVFEQLQINPHRDMISLIVLMAVFFAILKKKYDWDFSILIKKVEI